MAKKKKTKFNLKVWALWGGIGVSGVLLVCTLVLVLLPSYDGKTGFRTLAQMVSYAQRTPEHPPMDNTNLVRPDFTTFYDSQTPGFFARKWVSLKNMLGMKKEDDWTPGYFVELLNDSLVRHRAHGIKKNIVYRVTPEVGTQFVVWGDIQGAYHSVVRALQKLKEMNIIDDNLKIVAPKTYFVFMGDVVSRSAYGMQIFSVLFRLLQVNPGKVIYLRGNHEDKKYWHAFGMKAQMKHFLSGMQEKAFVKEVDELFLYLPLGVYLPIPNEKHEFVRLSHLGSARSKKLKEERYTLFLHEEQKESIDRHQIDKKTTDSTPVHVKAVIRSEKKRNDFQEMDGIRLLPPDQGATAWNLLSSPTKVTQEGLKFFHDAFAIIKVGADKVNWSLTLYNQDVRQMNGYSTRSYQFFTGAEMGLDEIEGAQPPKPKKKEEVKGLDSRESDTLESHPLEDPDNKAEDKSLDSRRGESDRGREESGQKEVEKEDASPDEKPPAKETSSAKAKADDKEEKKEEETKSLDSSLLAERSISQESDRESSHPLEDPDNKAEGKSLDAGQASMTKEKPGKLAEPKHQTILPPLPPAPTTPRPEPATVASAPQPVIAPQQPIVIQPAAHKPYVTITIIPAAGTKIITTTHAPNAQGQQETVIETKTVK